MIAGAAMGYAGQKCTATRRVVVVGDAAARSPTRWWPPSRRYGSATRRSGVGGRAGDRRARPATRCWRGRRGARAPAGRGAHRRHGRPDRRRRRLLRRARAGPTGLDPAHPVAQEETFGPLAAILAAPDLGGAVDLANDVRYGLVTSVHGHDVGALLAAARRSTPG